MTHRDLVKKEFVKHFKLGYKPEEGIKESVLDVGCGDIALLPFFSNLGLVQILFQVQILLSIELQTTNALFLILYP